MPPRRAVNNQNIPEPTVDMAGAIEAIHAMATAMTQQSVTTAAQGAINAQQAAAQAQREALRDQREEAAAAARESGNSRNGYCYDSTVSNYCCTSCH
ncbi:hypothetical protein TSUD_135350 [Trifolium subterraneum]|uniref:Uncharacterized protein n=1 Tax=Trifolium subterraneum TaxID=3900 RepID=A0A2Z6P391_TRISU|nr:hypothetical protein TSUD_135350 [Trifolium subterraneum]